jgi:thymidylate synthase (FAD)
MKAEYVQSMGSDLTVVNAARVSFDKEGALDADGCLSYKDEKLIHYLSSHDHFTPFTHCTVTLRETVPIFVARQRFKHTVGFSYNEVSRRYVDDTPEFYYPEKWRKRADNKKQGSSTEEVKEGLFADGNTGDCYKADPGFVYSAVMEQLQHFYEQLIWNGVAPEQARMVLPQSMYTSYYVTGSLAAWARAYKLRSDPHAQAEIQELASIWSTLISPLYPVSWMALTTRVTPQS